jgi:NAD-reducing hydrogenase large subunit
LVKQLHAQSPALYKRFGSFRSNLLSLVRADGAMDLYDGVLRVRDASGAILFDGISDQNYLDLIEEEVRSWSYMKFPHLRSLGREQGWYRVGPLARVQNCDFIPSERAERERQALVAWGEGNIVHASLAYHWARMIEMLHAVEVIAELLDDPVLLSGDLLMQGAHTRSGVGVIEAPRGTLIHDYEVGDDDLVTRCNLIVATTHNNQAMNEAVRSVARDYLNGHEITEGLLNHIEVAIRAYDPCLSCATHALGQMPLEVSLVSMDGRVLDRVRKSPGSGLTRSFNESI